MNTLFSLLHCRWSWDRWCCYFVGFLFSCLFRHAKNSIDTPGRHPVCRCKLVWKTAIIHLFQHYSNTYLTCRLEWKCSLLSLIISPKTQNIFFYLSLWSTFFRVRNYVNKKMALSSMSRLQVLAILKVDNLDKTMDQMDILCNSNTCRQENCLCGPHLV